MSLPDDQWSKGFDAGWKAHGDYLTERRDVGGAGILFTLLGIIGGMVGLSSLYGIAAYHLGYWKYLAPEAYPVAAGGILFGALMFRIGLKRNAKACAKFHERWSK